MHMLWAGEALARRVGADRRGQRCVGASAGGGMIDVAVAVERRWAAGDRRRGDHGHVGGRRGGAGFTGRGEPVRFVLTRVEEQPAVACNEEWRFGSVLLDAGALSDAQLREAAELLAHLNEASFGYRSGDPGRAVAGGAAAGV